MSDAHNEHESVIKTPKQLVAAIAAGFLIPIICIILLVQFVANRERAAAGSDSQTPEAMAERLKPVADVGFTFKDANAPKQLLAGDAVYKANCAACHDSGAAGAPKTGDANGWAARLKKGYDALVQSAINGIGAMPAKGGNPDLDDVEVARAVVFMANQSGASFKEPEAPAAPAAPAQNAAAPAQGSEMTPPAQGAHVASATQPLQTPTQQAQALTPDSDKKAESSGQSAEVGKKVYEAACQACHTTGAAGAPRLGDKAAWAPRLQKGNAALYENAIKGIGAMPAKGGASVSDADVKAAVDYMTASAK